MEDELESFENYLQQHGQWGRIFATEYSLGTGPLITEPGDVIWLLEGAKVPIILRHSERRFIVVGECYVHEATRSHDKCAVCDAPVFRAPVESAREVNMLSHK